MPSFSQIMFLVIKCQFIIQLLHGDLELSRDQYYYFKFQISGFVVSARSAAKTVTQSTSTKKENNSRTLVYLAV